MNIRSIFTLATLSLAAVALTSAPADAAPRKDKNREKPVRKAAVDENADPYERAVDVFVAGKDNPYKSIRIPCITNAGGLLVAMAEGRYENSDQGRNDLIVSVSKDGKKWSKPVVAASSQGATFNNPCLIYDKEARQIVLLFQRYPAGVKERSSDIPAGWEGERCIRNFVSVSKNGRKWSKPKDVTEFTKHADATITCSGPNPGVQLTRGEHKGRLVVPFNEAKGFGNWVLTAAYSDDHGKTWQVGEKTPEGRGINEVSIAETDEGGVIVVSRAWGGGQRRVAYSSDGGESWGEVINHPELPSPKCQNGLARYSFADDAKRGGKSRLLFSTPSTGRRTDGLIKMSYDDGKTWPVEKLIGPGPYAYSALCAFKPGEMGLLFEVNGNPLTTIRFTTFTIDWLTDGEDSGKADSASSDASAAARDDES